MKKPKFRRQNAHRYSKLGKNRKKMQVWKRPKGRDSKMRLKRKSYPASVRIGYRSSKKISGKINGAKPILVHNLRELAKLNKRDLVILAKVGARKKLQLISEAEKMNVKIINLGGKR